MTILTGRLKRRFTPDEDDAICNDWNAYVPVEQIAIKISRDCGTVRQRLQMLKEIGTISERRGNIVKILRWCPEHLKPILQKNGAEAFLDAVRNATDASKEHISDLTCIEQERCISEIESKGLERKEKMMAFRAIGMTLEEIGNRFGISRERTRQLTDPAFKPYKYGLAHNLLVKKTRLEKRLLETEEKIKQEKLHKLLSAWTDADGAIQQEFLKQIKSIHRTRVVEHA